MRQNSPYLDSRRKRVFDVVVAIGLAAPTVVLLLLVGVAVRLFNGRPVFLRQQRVGRGGKLFGMLKVRTMIQPGPSLPPKPTRVGRFLRRHRLDELPQLLHVLSGQMSMVGPRPELPEIASGYCQRHRRRLEAKPGLTGLWQIKGDHRLLIHDQIGYDLYYIKRATLWLDIVIVLLTALFVVRPGVKGSESGVHPERVPARERDVCAEGNRVFQGVGLGGIDTRGPAGKRRRRNGR